MNLVIVESPTKARTLAKYLGKNYRIEASMGHIRDLPKSELGVDTENNYLPKYIVPRDKKKKVNELKKIADSADMIWLASDPDREGEAIAWHIAELLHGSDKRKTKGTKPQQVQRVEFHEITEGAIKDAFNHPREINFQLVDAQQARRVLDRLVGYKLSPLLWKKVKKGLSAGRVQTVALRLIVEREREIEAFKAIEYWTIEVTLKAESKSQFIANLVALNGTKLEINNETEAKLHVENLEKATYQIEKIIQKEVRRTPPPPFTTSTLQQAAGNKLGMSARKAMMIAQNLYEQGFITYMRTDSVNLSTLAQQQAKEYITTDIGPQYALPSPRIYRSKSKNAQEAHEAIRPTAVNLIPDKLPGESFTRDHKRLYELIWKRTVASQMTEAVFDQTTIEVKASISSDYYTLRATGSVLKFDGWLNLYGVLQEAEEEVEKKPGQEEEAVVATDRKQILPKLSEGENVTSEKINPLQHFTEPPPRFTEASLVKKLEELGIGRPSTYAPIISTIQDRFYVEREERKFKPTPLGLAVNDFLIQYFPEVFDYTFTASMEDKLDDIASRGGVWQDTIGEFYKPFEKKLAVIQEQAVKVELAVETVDKLCPKCGKQLVVRTGKFGKFLACSGFPDCKHTEALEEKIDAKCPTDGGDVVVRKTKKGKVFYGCKNWPNCKYASWTKPKAENSDSNTDKQTEKSG